MYKRVIIPDNNVLLKYYVEVYIPVNPIDFTIILKSLG